VPKSKSKTTIKIFYAWQSDLPAKFNRHAIKKALQLTAAEIEGQLSEQERSLVEIVIDEATRDLPGSPHIPTAILEKIQAADIFVADVSTINSGQSDESKKTPNPNVVFELGHAVAHLGWERVLLLVNEIHGSVKGLPFDFDRQRASPFKLGEGVIGSKSELVQMLTVAISLIINKNPPRPRSGHFDIERAKRERDVTNLRWLLGSLNWPTLDEHIASGAKYLSMDGTLYFDEVTAIISSSTFHLYDEGLKVAVLEFVKHWHDSMKFDHYTPMIGSRAYIFTHGSPTDAAKEDKDWEYMDAARVQLHKAKDVLLSLIREQYPEIDLQASSDSAGVRLARELADTQKRFAGLGSVVKLKPRKRKNKHSATKKKVLKRKE
jgi:hypothetical protein